MKRATVEKLERLGDRYLAWKVKADAYSTARHSIGKRIVAICAKQGKKRTKIEQDNKTLVVGYDEAIKYEVDEEALRRVLGEELMDRVAVVTVDHDKLARLFESGDLSNDQYRAAKKCIEESVTKRPYVRKT